MPGVNGSWRGGYGTVLLFRQALVIANHYRKISTPIFLTSVPGDPLHIGHTRLLLESGELAKDKQGHLFVIVNDDDFLMKKKGYVFMPLAERMEVIAGIRGVDYVAPWTSHTQFVDQAILALRPTYFLKGGDRSSPADVAECERLACEAVGCEILYGVGGDKKVQSSSLLVEKEQKRCK